VTDEEAKLLLTRIDERTKQLVERKEDQEERIRLLEKQVWWFSGAATIGGAFLGYIGKKLGL
jgi:hypothetical protein